MMTRGLPRQVCILDVETAKTSFVEPERSELAFAGCMTYTLRGGRYYQGAHTVYLPDKLRVLEDFLKQFEGPVVGHNILAFDYRVLRPHLDLEGIVEKTVDTLAFLYRKRGKAQGLRGLKLDVLAGVNLGRSKTLRGSAISKLWRSGKRKKVIEYNRNDLQLTFGIWSKLVRRRRLSVGLPFLSDQVLIINSKDVETLIGKRPLYKHTGWNTKINRDGYLLVPEGRRVFGHGVPDWYDMSGFIPFEACKKCGSPNLEKIEVDFESLSEGQIAEFYAGTWGTVWCIKCDYEVDYAI